MLTSKEMLLVKSVLVSEEPSFPAKFGGEAEEDLHHPLLRLPHLLLFLATVQVFVFVFIFVLMSLLPSCFGKMKRWYL